MTEDMDVPDTPRLVEASGPRGALDDLVRPPLLQRKEALAWRNAMSVGMSKKEATGERSTYRALPKAGLGNSYAQAVAIPVGDDIGGGKSQRLRDPQAGVVQREDEQLVPLGLPFATGEAGRSPRELAHVGI